MLKAKGILKCIFSGSLLIITIHIQQAKEKREGVLRDEEMKLGGETHISFVAGVHIPKVLFNRVN